MTSARNQLAILVALALVAVVALVPAAPAVPVAPPAEEEAKSEDEKPAPQSIYAGTGIGFVLEANNNEVPKNGEEMVKALAKVGEFVQLPVTFSAVDLQTGLQKPRVVITHKPTMHRTDNLAPNDRIGPAEQLASGVVLAPTSSAGLKKPNLEGRLYLAANMETVGGELKVKTFEFISWNSRKQRFDFGFIECDEVEPQIRVVDGVRCFSCHKNRGPILGQGPWSNTTHNDVIRVAVAAARDLDTKRMASSRNLGQPRRLDTGLEFGTAKRGNGDEVDGLSLLLPQGPAVDAAVRTGADMIRDRAVYRLMTQTPDGRTGLVLLLGAIASPGHLDKNNQAVRPFLNREFQKTFQPFIEKVAPIHKASSSTLVDHNPSGAPGKLMNVVTESPGAGWGSGSTLQTNLVVVWSGTSQQVSDYDAKRSKGQHGVPSTRLPSNPKAFVPVSVALNNPSQLVNAGTLARLIGLTEGDRLFMAQQLVQANFSIRAVGATPESLAKDVFSSDAFSEVFLAGEIPDREDFKDRFVKGLNDVLARNGAKALKLDRKDYASGPNVSPVPGKEEKEIPTIATTACVRCHEVQKGKAAFSPIPMLAFDPFDKVSREAWAKATDAKKRTAVLTRLWKRVNEDKDMPPEDSAEYDTFRAKNSPQFDAMKEWLDAELKK